jgi:murein DD-endopeptidase MepM/ murein hydrolase activator NlpD
VALPAAIGAAVAKARPLRVITGALGGRSSRNHRARSCCLTSFFGCAACAAILFVVTLAIGGALIAATASLVGAAFPGADPCAAATPATCSSATPVAVGAPMSCPGLYVSQGFGNTPWEHPHTGIDIVCPAGTRVVAVTAGIFHRRLGAPVACTYPQGRAGGLGINGELDADGMRFVYGHLEAFAAADGALVSVGQVLGYEGSTGCATGDHLHFEVDADGKPVDPCPLLPPGYPDTHDPTGRRCWGAALP